MKQMVYIGTPENWPIAQAELAEDGYKLSDGVPLSPTGMEPITSRGTSTHVYLETEPLASLRAPLLDAYEEPWDQVLAALKLQVVEIVEEASADDVCRT